MLKKRIVILFILSILFQFRVIAVEGMWLPSLIHKNIEEMQQMGLQLTAEDLYSEDLASLKDAIVRFGRGCTGAFISGEGLLLTNHHCGYGVIQSHSTVENDYLTQGFWAAARDEELPNPGLTITLLVRMENVTARVLEALDPGMSESQRNRVVRNISREIADEATEDGRYEAMVNPFYFGNEYFLFVYNVYRDLRLVGAPPSSVGKFGGDVDNWMWPRHSGDFALFRVYADGDNNPADFHEENVPYRPAHYFPVSNRGLQEHDFTMVYGYPGRTNRYLTSDAVRFIMENENPMGIEVRTRILDIYERHMSESDAVRIKYSSKHARVSNAWKRWKGENRGLESLDAVNVKIQQETEFEQWVASEPLLAASYEGLIDAFRDTYSNYHPYRFAFRLYMETIRSIEVTRLAEQFSRLVAFSKEEQPDMETIQEEIERLKSYSEGFFRDYHPEIDREILAEMLRKYIHYSDEMMPDAILELQNRHRNDMNNFAERVFRRTMFVSREQVMELLDDYRPRHYRRIERDPAFQFINNVNTFVMNELQIPQQRLESTLDSLYRLYTAGLRAMKPDYNFFPDANGTLRITYGRVEGSFPRDAVQFLPFSTAEGILEKAAQREIEDYRISDRLDNLLSNRSYGDFNNNDELVVNFIASNHTTGGNSGSPVIDGQGNLIGLNFDRSWESTMSDIMFDPDQCRNISVNSQYILWVIAKYAEMDYLIEEMDVVGSE
ncbi:MAG: S46 family peptidase [Bacteroidetes bacterium]|nr:MAG: S46 family peptidase [Bacteroidota bacterium]